MKQIFVDIEKILFDKIKNNRLSEITDILGKKKLGEGDVIIFQCEGEDENIKGTIRKIKKYESIRSIITERKVDTIEIGDIGNEKQFDIMDDLVGGQHTKIDYRLIDIDFHLGKK